jgi:hypothetical protein
VTAFIARVLSLLKPLPTPKCIPKQNLNRLLYESYNHKFFPAMLENSSKIHYKVPLYLAMRGYFLTNIPASTGRKEKEFKFSSNFPGNKG